MGDIGKERREVEFEPLPEQPLTEPAPLPSVPENEPAPQPAVPAQR